jgi:cbb3-type cytochrome oxidase subunit 3
MVATGVSVAFIIGTVLRWRVLALTGMFTLYICIFNHQKKNNATDSKSGSLPLKSCRTYPLCNSACWPISHSRVSQMAGKKQQYLYINDKE